MMTPSMKVKSPFQTWDWNYNWWYLVENRECELLILEAFEGKDVFGFAPLVIKNKSIEFIGDKHFDYGAITLISMNITHHMCINMF